MKYEVLAGDTVIGWSELEYGDPPMGVAFGVLHANTEYALFNRATVLRVRPAGGEFFKPQGGVHIQNQPAEPGTTAVEVVVLGLDSDTYERYFPEHLTAYDERLAR